MSKDNSHFLRNLVLQVGRTVQQLQPVEKKKVVKHMLQRHYHGIRDIDLEFASNEMCILERLKIENTDFNSIATEGGRADTETSIASPRIIAKDPSFVTVNSFQKRVYDTLNIFTAVGLIEHAFIRGSPAQKVWVWKGGTIGLLPDQLGNDYNSRLCTQVSSKEVMLRRELQEYLRDLAVIDSNIDRSGCYSKKFAAFLSSFQATSNERLQQAILTPKTSGKTRSKRKPRGFVWLDENIRSGFGSESVKINTPTREDTLIPPFEANTTMARLDVEAVDRKTPIDTVVVSNAPGFRSTSIESIGSKNVEQPEQENVSVIKANHRTFYSDGYYKAIVTPQPRDSSRPTTAHCSSTGTLPLWKSRVADDDILFKTPLKKKRRICESPLSTGAGSSMKRGNSCPCTIKPFLHHRQAKPLVHRVLFTPPLPVKERSSEIKGKEISRIINGSNTILPDYSTPRSSSGVAFSSEPSRTPAKQLSNTLARDSHTPSAHDKLQPKSIEENNNNNSSSSSNSTSGGLSLGIGDIALCGPSHDDFGSMRGAAVKEKSDDNLLNDTTRLTKFLSPILLSPMSMRIFDSIDSEQTETVTETETEGKGGGGGGGGFNKGPSPATTKRGIRMGWSRGVPEQLRTNGVFQSPESRPPKTKLSRKATHIGAFSSPAVSSAFSPPWGEAVDSGIFGTEKNKHSCSSSSGGGGGGGSGIDGGDETGSGRLSLGVDIDPTLFDTINRAGIFTPIKPLPLPLPLQQHQHTSLQADPSASSPSSSGVVDGTATAAPGLVVGSGGGGFMLSEIKSPPMKLPVGGRCGNNGNSGSNGNRGGSPQDILPSEGAHVHVDVNVDARDSCDELLSKDGTNMRDFGNGDGDGDSDGLSNVFPDVWADDGFKDAINFLVSLRNPDKEEHEEESGEEPQQEQQDQGHPSPAVKKAKQSDGDSDDGNTNNTTTTTTTTTISSSSSGGGGGGGFMVEGNVVASADGSLEGSRGTAGDRSDSSSSDGGNARSSDKSNSNSNSTSTGDERGPCADRGSTIDGSFVLIASSPPAQFSVRYGKSTTINRTDNANNAGADTGGSTNSTNSTNSINSASSKPKHHLASGGAGKRSGSVGRSRKVKAAKEEIDDQDKENEGVTISIAGGSYVTVVNDVHIKKMLFCRRIAELTDHGETDEGCGGSPKVAGQVVLKRYLPCKELINYI